MGALRERGILRRNAPHLVHDVPFVVPNYSWWETPFYGIGLKVYDLLAGQYGFGKSRLLSREETLERLPTLRQDGLRGGVVYHDGQFDDARLLIHLLLTAVDQGAMVLNYAPAVEIRRGSDGFVCGVVAEDRESGQRFSVDAQVVINATGIFADETRRLADASASPMMVPSQGIHLVLDGSFLRGNTAIMVPHTSDGRVLFAIPWHGHTVVGTTDTPIDGPSYEPRRFEHEIEFVLETASEYLSHPPRREDVLSVFVGIRPLVRQAGASANDHVGAVARSHGSHRRFGVADHRRRQMDDVPADGGGHGRSRHHAGQAGREAVRDARVADPRLPRGCHCAQPPLGLRVRCGEDSRLWF